MEAIIVKQQELIALLEQINTNFKKDSSDRKTAEYIAKRLEKLDAYWNEFKGNHEHLLSFEDESHEYFLKNMYQQVWDYYKATRDMIVNFESKVSTIDNKASTSTREQSESTSMLKRLMSQQKTNFKAFIRQINYCVLDEIEEKWELEDELRAIQTRWDTIDKLHWQIDNLLEEADPGYEEEYNENDIRYRNIKRQLNQKLSSTSHLKESTPKMEIPTFTGIYTQWPTFYDLFKEAIHFNNNISKSQKMQHLKSKVKGEAERLIQHLHVSIDNYDIAWNILCQRYNNKQLLFTKQVEVFLNQPVIQKQTADEIRKLHDISKECVHAIENLGVDTYTWGPLLVHLICKKLDSETYRDYFESRKKPRELADFAELLTFLEGKFTALEPITKTAHSTTTLKHSVTNRNDKNDREKYTQSFSFSKKPIPTRAYHTNFKVIKCPLCNIEHALYQCRKFASMSPDAKLDTIAKFNICNNCLHVHELGICKSVHRCKTCNAAHNTLLHDAICKKPTSSNSNVSSSRPTGSQQSNANHVDNENEEMLLTTVQVRAKAADGSYVTLNALLDQGSQITLITENAVQRLGLRRQHVNASVSGVGIAAKKGKGKVTLECKSIYNNYDFSTEALIMSKVVNNLPNISLPKADYTYLQSIQLADPDYHVSKQIDLLLDVKIYSEIIMSGLLRGKPNQPIAQQTKLGWILSGNVSSNFNCNVVINNTEDMSRFWEIEEVIDNVTTLTEREQWCEDFYESTTTRRQDGRYEVRLPLTEKFEERLGASKPKAIAQFRNLETRLVKNEQLGDNYKLFMQEYISLGHMKKCVIKKEPSCFLPHHDISGQDPTLRKFRVVFNASSKTQSGFSLNDVMECGPKLQSDIQGLLINWRTFRYGYSADCEKMYRMILVHENDQHLQKIVWRDQVQNPIEEYQLCTLTYGTKAAPFLALRTMKQLAKDEAEKYPLGAKVLLTNVYVDDLLSGHNQLDLARQTQQQLIDMLKGAGINLRKWSSNTPELLDHLPREQLNPTVLDFKNTESTKTLGLRWEPISDSFKFQSKLDYDIDLTLTNYTKRMMLSDISKLFDPLGWLSPITIKAKLLFQKAWSTTTLDWDDVIADDIRSEWVQLRNDLKNIDKFDIPRWVGNTEKPIQLHGFSDASEKGLACSVYVKTVDDNGRVITRLMAAKTKLAPIKKPVSLPRLELCASVLLAKLLKKILTSISDSMIDIQTYGYTDSMVVIGWLQGDISRWKTFVANRVREITAILPASCWRHTKSADNAADCATRGMTPSQLINHSLWWEGPIWLKDDIIPEEKTYDPPTIETKSKQVLTVQVPTSPVILDIINKHSSMTHAVRIICWVSRFIARTRHNADVVTSEYLTANEMRAALQLIIRTVQAQHFGKDIARLKAKQNLKSKSTILTLSPFLDENNILRVGGRLQHAKLTFDTKHPMLLPHDSHLTRLVINEAHRATLHGGATLTLAHCRGMYWIIGGTRAVKKQIKQCTKCQRFSAQGQYQLMANLPEARVTPSKPFTHTGVDFTGFVDVKANKGRGIKTLKGYIAVFVCFSTKAVHLELVSDLSAPAFLAALKRMCARRGVPTHMYSDNGTNFVGAAKVLTKEYREALKVINTECLGDISSMGITWHFNAPGWPSAGGLWEAMVKSVKHHLKRVIGEQKLTFDEFYTLLTQIEACLNSRPLYALSENIDDDIITPGHFLVGGPLLSTPLSSPEEPVDIHTRWQMVEKMHKSFWQKWSGEYLQHLQKRTKWQRDRPNVQINDIVLVNEENMPPSKWALAKVVDVHPGKDGLVRVVTLKTKNGMVKRPIVKLTPLPVRQELDDRGQRPDSTETDIKDDNQTSHIQTRSRRGRKRSNFLVAALLLFMTCITPSMQQLSNVTSIGSSTTLYFDKVAEMRVVQDQWKMIVYYNMTNYWQSITDITNYLEHLRTICGNDIKFTPLLSQFDHELNEMTHYNDLLRTSTTKLSNRVRRGLVNVVGNIANSLFGVLDDKFAEQYQKDIETVKTTEGHLFKMLKNQTSIIEAENNILKRNEAIMNHHFTYINSYLKNMSQDLNEVKLANANHLKMFSILTTAMSTDVIISNLRRIQDTLIDTITNIYHGQLDIHLLSPNQLQNQLNIISGQLQGELMIPTTNIRDLYQLLQVQAKVTKQYLIIEIKIPLLSHSQFDLNKIISLPWIKDDTTVYNVPSTSYIAFNIKRDMIIPLNDNDINSCLKFRNNQLLCYENHPMFNVQFGQSLCELRLFKNNYKQTFCRAEIRQCSDRWIKLQSSGAWLYSCCRECLVRILCPAGLETKYLQGNGVIDIGQGCVVKSDTFTIHAEHDYTNEMYVQKNIDIPAIHKYSSPLNNMINTSLNDSVLENLENHDQLFDDISQRIEVLKSQDLQLLQDSSMTHYYTIYGILAMLILFIGVYIGYQQRSRCSRARGQPGAGAAQDARPVVLELGRVPSSRGSANSVSAVRDGEVMPSGIPVPIGCDISGSVLSVDRATSPTFTRTIKFNNLPKP